jgi:Cu2+-exporting ATPase
MKNTFKISGMTCDGCRTKVEKTLNAINGITKATVSLTDNAEIEIETHIATETIQEALSNAGNYTIEVASNTDNEDRG